MSRIEHPELHFWSRTDKSDPDGCWPWLGSVVASGYGQAWYEGQFWHTHRLAWMLTHSDPGSMQVLHRCDNPPCNNPGHLFLGTHADNMRDMASKGRANHKLTPVQVLRIRSLKGQLLQRDIALSFGISQSMVSVIQNRKRWQFAELRALHPESAPQEVDER